jgi:hypothetical protein
MLLGPNILNIPEKYLMLLISEKNNLQCIVRSHAEIREGCGMSHEGCYTVFSAPNQVNQVI